MKDVLERIVAHKHREVEEQSKILPLNTIKKNALSDSRTPLDMVSSIQQPNLSGIIAEYKRQSPSKGVINDRFEVEEITKAYESAGASALSILTDWAFFGGRSSYLREAREAVRIPILRKEFIISTYQIYEAKVIGADAILLIAECLSKNDIQSFSQLASDLGMQVLLELHAENQLTKIPEDGIDLIGVNNRDLNTFEVDFESSIRLLPKLPDTACRIAESGLQTPEQILYLHEAGFEGFLIGETFMKEHDPIAFVHDFIHSYLNLRDEN